MRNKLEKEELRQKRLKLIYEIKKCSKDYILKIYKKVKELYQIEMKINKRHIIQRIASDLNCSTSWVMSILSFDNATESTWDLINNNQITPEVTMKILNCKSKKIIEKQNELFKEVISERLNNTQIDCLLRREFSRYKKSYNNSNYILIYQNLHRAKNVLLLTNLKKVEKETIIKIVSELADIINILESRNLIKKSYPIKIVKTK